MTPENETPSDRSRIRLNIGLWLLVVLTAVAVIVLSSVMWGQHSDDGGSVMSRIGHTIVDKQQSTSVDAGDDVGSGVVQEMALAPDSDQQRYADVLEAATKFANAFMNLNYKTVDSSISAVESMGTTGFRKQFAKAAPGLKKAAVQLHSVSTSEVVWAAYEAGDADSATVILATNGTVTSTASKGQPVARPGRVRVDLAKVGDRWLGQALTYVGGTQ